MTSAPTLFRGPEAVIGVVIAAAALLTDFAKNLFKLSFPSFSSALYTSTNISRLTSELQQVDASIQSLQKALDSSKSLLQQSERTLDVTLAKANTTDKALSSAVPISDMKLILVETRQQTSDLISKLLIVRSTLKQQLIKKKSTFQEVEYLKKERSKLLVDIQNRKTYLNNLLATSSSAEDVEKLQQEITEKDLKLQNIKNERLSMEQNLQRSESKILELEQESMTISQILNDTQSQVENLALQAKEKEIEIENIEQSSTQLKVQKSETDRLKNMVKYMEGELNELQDELKQRDVRVENVSKESDSLRSLLQSKEAELTRLAVQLDQLKKNNEAEYIRGQTEDTDEDEENEKEWVEQVEQVKQVEQVEHVEQEVRGKQEEAQEEQAGQEIEEEKSPHLKLAKSSSPSDMNLLEIDEDIKAGQLQLSADIQQAKLDGLEMSKFTSQMKGEPMNAGGVTADQDEDMDEIEKINVQIDVEEKRLKADMIKVNYELRRKEYDTERKTESVNEILESVENESMQNETETPSMDLISSSAGDGVNADGNHIHEDRNSLKASDASPQPELDTGHEHQAGKKSAIAPDVEKLSDDDEKILEEIEHYGLDLDTSDENIRAEIKKALDKLTDEDIDTLLKQKDEEEELKYNLQKEELEKSRKGRNVGKPEPFPDFRQAIMKEVELAVINDLKAYSEKLKQGVDEYKFTKSTIDVLETEEDENEGKEPSQLFDTLLEKGIVYRGRMDELITYINDMQFDEAKLVNMIEDALNSVDDEEENSDLYGGHYIYELHNLFEFRELIKVNLSMVSNIGKQMEEQDTPETETSPSSSTTVTKPPPKAKKRKSKKATVDQSQQPKAAGTNDAVEPKKKRGRPKKRPVE